MKISTQRLRKIIREELSLVVEQLDHVGIRDVVTTSSKLLSALEDFESSASGQMTHSASQHLQKLKALAEDMIGNPASYLDPNEEQQVAKDEAAPVATNVKVAKKPEAGKVMGEVPSGI